LISNLRNDLSPSYYFVNYSFVYNEKIQEFEEEIEITSRLSRQFYLFEFSTLAVFMNGAHIAKGMEILYFNNVQTIYV